MTVKLHDYWWDPLETPNYYEDLPAKASTGAARGVAGSASFDRIRAIAKDIGLHWFTS